MADNETTEQEVRPAQATLRLTVAEKRALVLVAAHRNLAESDLLRVMTIGQIVAERARLFPAQPDAVGAA